MTKQEAIPSFILPSSIESLDENALREHLRLLRERRLSAAKAYEASKLRAAQEQDVKLQKQLAKQLDILKKEIAKSEKSLDKIEGRINKIALLRLEREQLK